MGKGSPRFFGATPTQLTRLAQTQHAFQASNVTMFTEDKTDVWRAAVGTA